LDSLIPELPFTLGLLAGMLLFMEIGRRLGIRRRAKTPATGEGTGVVDGAVFGLFGLLIAFTFSGAASRFDSRRQLIAEEANAIGTAYLRIDLLPSASQPAVRELFRSYVDSRLRAYRKLPDVEAALAELAESSRLQREIWNHAVEATRMPDAHPAAARLMLPAVNEMIDITTTRTMAARIHPPAIIYRLLFGFALLCSLLAGHAMAGSPQRSWTHILAFVLAIGIATFAIVDIEYPRAGLIRMDAADWALVEVREAMK
jgi:hypothetical protein